MAQSEWVKDPDAVLDYVFDWAALTNGTGPSDWLASGETIAATYSVAVVGGAGGATDLTINSSTRTDSNTSITVWLSKGVVGTEYGVRCRVVTSDLRTDDRTIRVKVEDR